jgi:ribosome-associated protein
VRNLDTLEIAKDIITALDEIKGEDIILLDVRERFPFADYFLICSGSSNRMLKGLAKAVEDAVKQKYGLGGRVEGVPEDGWLLIDFGDIIVNLFSYAQREYYRLEDLWREAKVILRLQ